MIQCFVFGGPQVRNSVRRPDNLKIYSDFLSHSTQIRDSPLKYGLTVNCTSAIRHPQYILPFDAYVTYICSCSKRQAIKRAWSGEKALTIFKLWSASWCGSFTLGQCDVGTHYTVWAPKPIWTWRRSEKVPSLARNQVPTSHSIASHVPSKEKGVVKWTMTQQTCKREVHETIFRLYTNTNKPSYISSTTMLRNKTGVCLPVHVPTTVLCYSVNSMSFRLVFFPKHTSQNNLIRRVSLDLAVIIPSNHISSSGR